MMNEIETDATKELRETPLSCWAFVNELVKAGSIVIVVSPRCMLECSLKIQSSGSVFRAGSIASLLRICASVTTTSMSKSRAGHTSPKRVAPR
jgi:hypothetical protein